MKAKNTNDSDRDIVSWIVEYWSGTMEDVRQNKLMEWVNEKKENEALFLKICSEQTFKERYDRWSKIDTKAAIQKFDNRTSKHVIKRWLIGASVAAVVLVGLTISFLVTDSREEVVSGVAQTEISPGSSKAVLILAGGKQVALSENGSLTVALQNGKQAVNKDKQLVYESGVAAVAEYNELRTPRGGEYQVTLSDGSVIRMNSGSSLKYPVAFSGDKREVELTGEAYFEVAEGTIPFIVKAGDIAVKVYGTTFNINTHLAGRIQTALVEGKVGITVKNGTKETVLAPSQLADFNTQTLAINVRETDLSPYLAWTNGLFMFTNETLQQIMNTLSLWYDIDVFYQNPGLQQLHFTGCVKRYERIDNILNALSQSVGVKFGRQGKTLLISH